MIGIISVSAIAGGVIGAGICYVWAQRSARKKFAHLELEAKAKAKAISNEAELLLQEAHVKIKAKELEQEGEFQKRIARIEERNRSLILQKKELEKEEEKLQLLQNKLRDKDSTGYREDAECLFPY